MSLIYNAVKAFDSIVIDTYFRKITVIGLENIPKDGPIIISGNHSNQFIDAMMILSRSPRPLSFCMAASSLTKPVVGYLAQKIEVIPVYRPEDSKVLGKGKLRFTSKNTIEGEDAQFLTQTKNHQLGIQYIQLEDNEKIFVDSIISETKIKIKENPELYNKHKDSIAPFVNYYIIPKIDNSLLFKEAYQVLEQGKAICIFPEGTSHDRTNFIKLKAGVALMALGAMADHGTKNIKIISAGLSYFKRDQFRSEAFLEFGQPLEIPTEWAQLFKTDKKQAINKTLEAIEERMKSVTLTAPSYKEYNCINLVRDIYIPDGVKIPDKDVSLLGKRFAKCYERFKDETIVKRLMRLLTKYHESLENVGLEDQEVKEFYYSYGFFVRKTIVSFILFHLYLLLAFPIIAVTSPFLWFIRKKAEKERVKAKAKNPYKIKALDVVSSVKVTSFVKFIPFVYIIWIAFTYIIVNVYLKGVLKESYSFWYIFKKASAIFPIYAFICPYMIDSLYFYLETMKIRFLYFCYPKEVYKLKDERVKLSYIIRDLVESTIDKTEYANDRIVKEFKEKKNLKGRDTTCRIDKKEKKFKNELEAFLEQENMK